MWTEFVPFQDFYFFQELPTYFQDFFVVQHYSDAVAKFWCVLLVFMNLEATQLTAFIKQGFLHDTVPNLK